MDQVLDYTKKHYDKKLSTDDLASVAALSKYHFIRVFKRHTGQRPYELLTTYRINQSKTLLKETDHSINLISELAGFGDVNNYIRHFKKLVGTTPGVYRKNPIV